MEEVIEQTEELQVQLIRKSKLNAEEKISVQTKKEY